MVEAVAVVAEEASVAEASVEAAEEVVEEEDLEGTSFFVGNQQSSDVFYEYSSQSIYPFSQQRWRWRWPW